ncbi:MAG: hypothetical protein LBS43_07485 [Prevotellaceae bacterium]|jgi:hypothetical protein|nr:hypothetical protein [Prevotellaceae bacterium]
MEVIQGANGWDKKLKFILEHDGVELELNYAPQGWRDLEIQWQRELKNSAGIHRTFAVPLRFVKEGADFMRAALSKGLEEIVNLRVYRHTYDSADWRYVLEFNCKAAFVEAKDTDIFFECPFTDEGLPDYLSKHGGAKYEIPIGSEYKIDVPDGVYLGGEAVAITKIEEKVDTSGFLYVPIPLNFISEQYPMSFNETDVNTNTRLFNPIGSGTMSSIIGKIKFFTNSGMFDFGDVNATVYFVSQGVRTVLGVQQFHYFNSNTTVEVDINYSNFNFNNQDYYLRLSFFADDGDAMQMVNVGFLNAFDDGTPDIRIEYSAPTAPFSFYGIPLYNLFQKLIEKIYPSNFNIISKLLTLGIGKDIYVTSGDGIRGFDNAAIKITLEELNKSVAAILGADFGTIGNEYIIEEKSYFFNNVEIADVGEVIESEVSIASDILANKIKVGYPDNEYDERNGRDEFNITLNFEVKINNNSETLDMISNVRADSYGIQFTKINLENKTTTDSDSDNDPFFVHVKHETSGQIVVNKDIQIISGSVNPLGVFNALLSPKRCLLRNSGWLASIFDKTPEDIEFISSDRQDSNLKSTDGITTITEKDNVPISSLSGKLFIPYYVEFDAPIPVGLTGAFGPFATGNFGYISFSINGNPLKGFPITIMESMAERKQQRCKVILHPDTPIDFLTEIRKKIMF